MGQKWRTLNFWVLRNRGSHCNGSTPEFGQITGDVRMDQTSINREFVRRHFEAVNRRDVQTVLGNMRPDLYDHEIEGDHKNDLGEGAQRLQVLMKQVPDLAVDVHAWPGGNTMAPYLVIGEQVAARLLSDQYQEAVRDGEYLSSRR